MRRGAATLHRLSLGAALALWAGAAGAQPIGVRNTKHNLSAGSGNAVRATSEQEICVFCHTPHSASAAGPLWNRRSSTATYAPYTGASLQTSPGQPNGASKLCLSCHDGTIAIGDVLNTPNGGPNGSIATTGTTPDGTMPAGRTLLGTALTNDHPVSMAFDASVRAGDGELADPSTLTGPVRLYEGSTPGVRNTVQCTTCHDPHTDQLPKFLRQAARGRLTNICLTCHTKPGWAGSTHESSSLTATIDNVTTQVNDHACMSCHAPHTVDGAERLLRNGASGGQSAIEQTCFQCHTSGGPAQNIQGEFNKTGGKHPVADSRYAGNHRPVFITQPPSGLPEGVLLQPGQPAPDSRFVDAAHVECVDCHNPHRVVKSNLLEGMRGIALNGAVLAAVQNDSIATSMSQQYAVCLRCHGDSYAAALPMTLASGLSPSNKRTEFQTANGAYHPVGGTGRNTSANLNAQLAPNGLGVSSVIRCTDCHNSDAYASTTGKVVRTAGAPSGPHGSANRSILRANYRNTPGVQSYSSSNFALCFRCHSESALYGSATNFTDSDQNFDKRGNLHALHLRDRIDKTGAVCKSCHYNIHSNVEASNTQYNIAGTTYLSPPSAYPTRMINFHPNIRGINVDGTPNPSKRPEWWFDPVTKERRCYLQCHTSAGGVGGEVMNGERGDGGKRARYQPASGDLP